MAKITKYPSLTQKNILARMCNKKSKKRDN